MADLYIFQWKYLLKLNMLKKAIMYEKICLNSNLTTPDLVNN